MKRHTWLKEKEYVSNLPIAGKCCWWLRIICYKSQKFGGGVFIGSFRFNLKNPLTWLLVLLLYLACMPFGIWDTLCEPVRYISKLIREGVDVEVDKGAQ